MKNLSKIAASMQAVVAQQVALMEASKNLPRFEPLPEGAFPAPSLSAWMTWSQAAQVPVVPATEVARFAVHDLLDFETPSPAVNAMFERLNALNAQLGGKEMLRWDCCAPMGIKWAMGDGASTCPTEPGVRDLHPGDPRAFDILMEFPADEVAVLQRPWVNAAVHDRYPVEFRVFVHQGQVKGVSNYYVQRALPATDSMLAYARASAAAAQRIVAAMKAHNAFPWVPGLRQVSLNEQQAVEATLDFLVTPAGEVMFLEAGPGAGLGAHPCCFYNPATGVVDPIAGVRLGVGEKDHPLHLPNPEA